jgi:UDP-N-acetylmuramoyl-tripeptide--D-alanyl-D-alanine ligase
VREALKTLQGLRGSGNAFAILGDMLELGERTAQWHEEIGGLLAETGIDHVFLKGAFARFTAAGATQKGLPEERIIFFDEPETVLASLRSHLKKDDWILIKGSRKMKLEAAAEAISAAFDLKP